MKEKIVTGLVRKKESEFIESMSWAKNERYVLEIQNYKGFVLYDRHQETKILIPEGEFESFAMFMNEALQRKRMQEGQLKETKEVKITTIYKFK